MLKQKISPNKKNNYSDKFYASIYGTLCNFGFTEIRLIWTRYSAFLIVNSIILGLIGRRGILDMNTELLTLLAFGGIVLTWLWMAMNSLGWTYQNLWYWYASRLKFTKVSIPLPTDFFAKEKDVPKPKSIIFVIAQLVAVLFVLVYALLIRYALKSSLIPITVVIIFLVTYVIAHKCFYNHVKKDFPMKPVEEEENGANTNETNNNKNIQSLQIANKSLLVSFGSLFVAALSLLYVFYLDFVAPAKVSIYYDKVIKTRLPHGDRESLLRQIIFDDVVSKNPSTQAKKLLKKQPDLKSYKESRNLKKIGEIINGQDIEYYVEDETIERYIGNRKFYTYFCIPVKLVNTGNKYAFIQHIYLRILSKKNPNKKWLYNTFVEFDTSKIGEKIETSDKDRMKSLFNGVGISSKEEKFLTPYFFPLSKVEEKDIHQEGLTPGQYEFMLIGYGIEKKEIFRSNIIVVELKASDFIGNFKGTDISTTFTNVEIEKQLI